MEKEFLIGCEPYRISWEGKEGSAVVRIDEDEHSAEIIRLTEHSYRIRLDGEAATAYAVRSEGKVYVHVSGHTMELEDTATAGEDAYGAGGMTPGGDSVSSSMPGKVVKLLVAEGDLVEMSQPLVIVEAMKMETPLLSPAAGTIRKVHFAEGDLVDAGKPIVEVDAAEQ
jgi:biotin carboxyl carrier protein